MQPPNRSSARRLGVGIATTALIVAAAVGSAPASASPGDPVQPPRPSGSGELNPDYVNGWFVELTGMPSSKGGRAAGLDEQRQRFRQQASKIGVEVDIRHDFRRLWNGVSADITQTEAAELTALDEVVAVYPVATVEAPEPTSESPAMTSALAMTGADVAQSELGLTGAGLKVAIMDTGVDYDHPYFGGSGTNGQTAFPTERVIAGHDFVGDDFNADASADSYNPVPAPDSEPDDCNGHGTHVAGIVGANGPEFTGVAPAVQFGAYRVFGCAGSTTADVMLAAMERALADDMDILNMSIGSAFSTWPQYPTAVGADALVDAGVVVVASIGNSGASGIWSAGAPGVGEKVIGTASFDNTQYDAATFTVSPDDRPVAYAPATGAPEPPTQGSLPLVKTGTPASTDDGCTAPLPDLTGSAALIQRGSCSFYQKAFNAQQAGAAAVVLYNNVPGSLSPTVAPPSAADPAIEIPVVAVTRDDGVDLDTRIGGGSAEITWTAEQITVENPTGGLISSFSSFGLTAELDVKPDLGAPGGLIRSTYPLEHGGEAVISGTSMASPHVAGAVALLLEADPETPITSIRDRLQNSAEPAPLSLLPDAGLLEPVHRQGAGLMQIDRSILAETSISPGKLALGESEAGPATKTLTLTNKGDKPVSYQLSNVASVSTADAPHTPGYYEGGSTADFGADQVTVPAGDSVDVTVTITPPDGPQFAQYGGYLVFTPDEGEALRVPYAGIVGDYQGVAAMTAGSQGFPFLGKITACDRFIDVECVKGGSWTVFPDGGATYAMADGDFPTVLVHLDYPVRSLTAKVYTANSDGTKGDPVRGKNNQVIVADYLGRSSSSGGFTPFVWDGTQPKSQGKKGGTKIVPNGNYVLEVTVLKALGDAKNADHTETWTSPAFTVDRSSQP